MLCSVQNLQSEYPDDEKDVDAKVVVLPKLDRVLPCLQCKCECHIVDDGEDGDVQEHRTQSGMQWPCECPVGQSAEERHKCHGDKGKIVSGIESVPECRHHIGGQRDAESGLALRPVLVYSQPLVHASPQPQVCRYVPIGDDLAGISGELDLQRTHILDLVPMGIGGGGVLLESQSDDGIRAFGVQPCEIVLCPPSNVGCMDVEPLVPKRILQELVLNCWKAREEIARDDVDQQENDACQESHACMSLSSIDRLG